jgi:hypothetical protein
VTSPAEQAAAEALAKVLNGHERVAGHVEVWTAADFADEAQAVVAALRPILAEETLDGFAVHLRELIASETFCEEAGDLGMKYAASEAEDAAAALRSTTTTEGTDPR